MIPKNPISIVIAILSFAVAALYFVFARLRSEQAAIMQLGANYPYSIHEVTFRGYAFNTCSLYPVKFFPDSMLYVTLSDKLEAAELSQEIFERALGQFEENIWNNERKALEFCETKISVPDKYVTEFYRSHLEYVSLFKVVLKQKRWLASTILFGTLVSDSVALDVKVTADALKRLEAVFRPPQKIVIDNRIFDLKNMTSFELFIMNEQLTWLRAEVEFSYRDILRDPQRKWTDKLMAVELEKMQTRKR